MNKWRLIICLIVVFIDQILKVIVQNLKPHFVVINNFFSIDYLQNQGAAWGSFYGKRILLILVAIILLGVICFFSKEARNNKLNDISYGLLFGGIIGNLIDRIAFGFVRDFISMIIFNYDFPVFNIADMAIVIGVFLLIIISFKEDKNGNSSRRK